MASTREFLKFVVTVATDSLRASVQAATREIDRFAGNAQNTLEGVSRAFEQGVNSRGTVTVVRELDREVANFGRNATASIGNVQAAFAGLAAAFAGTRVFGVMLGEFAEYEDAMLKVQALSSASASELAALKRQTGELAMTTRFSSTEAAMAMQQLAASGQTVEQIQNSMQAAMDIAAVGQMDMALAADQLTNIMSQFGIGAEKSADVADILSAGFTGAATSMTQLAEAMTYVGPVANAVGYSLGDTTALLMALANNGYKASMAGTALRGGISHLLNPSTAAAKILEKYNIEVLKADGSMRAFADIIEDLGKSAVTEAEMLEIFGDRAGPGMLALVKQGADAIREYGKQIDASGGKAREMADKMESGLGGAMRRVAASSAEVRAAFAEALAPAVIALADAFTGLAKWFLEMPEWQRSIVAWTAALAALGAALPAVVAALRLLFAFSGGGLTTLASFAGSVRAAVPVLTGLAQALGVAKLAFGGLAAAAAFGVVKIVELGRVLWDCKRASDEVSASQKRGEELRKRQAEQLARIGEQTGVTVKSFQDLMKAEKDGKIHYDEATKSWKKGAAERKEATEESVEGIKKATGEALEELVKQYKQYADEIRNIQDQLSGREKSLAAELREMGRSGMSDLGAWQDRKREAEEYVAAAKKAAEEARAAFASGDAITAGAKWKEAVQYADDAKSAYRALNQEVKDGDQVIIGKKEALEQAMAGVKEAGELGISILKDQQAETYKAMDALEEKSGFAALYTHLDEAEQKWLKAWQDMQAAGKEAVGAVGVEFDIIAQQATVVEENWSVAALKTRGMWVEVCDELRRKLDEACKPRTVTVYTAEVVKRAAGGIVGAVGAFARGGKLPGYGGGDRIGALLEAGEFVIRKEAVAKFGAGFFDALNSLRLPDFSALMPAPALAAATPAGPSRTVNINLTLPSGDTYQLTTDPTTADRIEREQARWWSLRSSNRVRRPGIGRTP